MRLNQTSRNKLAKGLGKFGIRDRGLAIAYVEGVQRPRTAALQRAEQAVAQGAVGNRHATYGWANDPNGPGAIFVQARTGAIIVGTDNRPIRRTGKLARPVYRVISPDMAREFTGDAENENEVPTMYADSAGNVTVGIGHLLTSAAAAKALPFVFTAGGQRAPGVVIERVFEAVKARHQAAYQQFKERAPGEKFPGLTFGAYEADAIVRLGAAAIGDLFAADFAVHFDVADEFYPMENLPPPVQVALFDLAFQVGGGNDEDGNPRGLQPTTYIELHPALLRRDWRRAADEMESNKPYTPLRNRRRAELAVKGLDPEHKDFFFTTVPKRTIALADVLMRLQ